MPSRSAPLSAAAAGPGYDIALQNTAGAAISLTVGGNGAATTYAGVLSGPGSLNVSGGAMTLTATNTYTGNTVVSGGTLTFTNTNTFGGVNNNFHPLGIVSIHQGAINVTGGVVTNTCQIDVGDTAGQTGTLTLSSGTASVSLGADSFSGMNVGYNGGTGVVTLSGNSLLDITPTNGYINVLDIGFNSNGNTGSAAQSPWGATPR